MHPVHNTQLLSIGDGSRKDASPRLASQGMEMGLEDQLSLSVRKHCAIWQSRAWLLLALLCAGCATVGPVDEARLFSRACNAVDGASQPLLDDLAVAERRQGQDNAATKAKKALYMNDCAEIIWAEPGFIEGFCLDDASYFAEIGDPLAALAFRYGIRLAGEYAEVLLSLCGLRRWPQTDVHMPCTDDSVHRCEYGRFP
jgi:hypothetical protein